MHASPKLSKKIKNSILSVSLAFSTLIASAPLSGFQSVTVNAATSDNYAKLLQQSLYLYDANMCGTGVNENSDLSWRSDCHTSDEADFGYHDAGDHVKFGLPQGYSASTLGWGYYEFKDSYSALGLTDHFKTVSDYFMKFFKASTILDGSGNVTRFCYQVGEGNPDHGYWGPPEAQTGSRKAFWVTSGASDIAAEYAAALALSYLNFGNAEDLKYAKALYKFAAQGNSVAKDGAAPFYTSDSCTDELAWAAGWLHIATKEQNYLSDLNSKLGYIGWIHSWNNVTLGAAAVQAHITGDWSKVNGYLNSNVTNKSGYWFLDKWGSARYNTTAQFVALAATKNSGTNYSSWAKGQMDYILGNNPSNTCFVVGFASNSSKYPHHRAASGYKNYDELGKNTGFSSNSHVLVGALVGGPIDAGGTYTDSVQDYIANEVAIDYNAGFVGAAAGLYSVYKTGSLDTNIPGTRGKYTAGSTTTTTPTTTTPYNPTTTTSTTRVTNTTTPPTSGSGVYTLNLAQAIDYSLLPATDKMIGWEWSEFGIPSTEKVTKVEVNISTTKSTIGKWQGAFGSSTTVSPDYWTQSTDMQQSISGTSGTITWAVDAATANIIQYGYGGELKFGIWWIDCGTFTIDSIKVYTNGSGSTVTTTPQQVTTTPQQITTRPTTTTSSSTGGNGAYTLKLGEAIDYSLLPATDKMIGWEWSEFGIPSTEKVTKVEVNISTTKSTIGKWQGAFGSSTTVSPDYWTQSTDMQQSISGTSGTITWAVDAATANIIQYGYGGELKFGIWWIDCGTFTIDSIKVYTNGSGSVTTTTPVVTTRTTTTTTRATTTTTPAPTKIYGDLTGDGRVNNGDLVSISQYLVGDIQLSSAVMLLADVTNDGKVDVADLALIKQLLMGDSVVLGPRR